MYEDFYRLKADPFRLSPDHRFCFAHSSYAKAKAYLEFGLRRAEGLVAITGRPGTGKSTLVEDLLVGLTASRMVIVRLVCTQLVATELLRMVAFEFKIQAEGMDKATLLRRIEAFLATQAGAGRRVLIIVDEAQDLADDALEELRLLTNLQLKGKPLAQVFLLGQDQLHKRITSPELEQLRQRLLAVSRLQPMTLEETHAYISHRLKQAGWVGDPEIKANAVERIYRHSNGVPRLVNQTCSRLLLHGCTEEKHVLDGGDAELVVNELLEEAPQLLDDGQSKPLELQPSVALTRVLDIKASTVHDQTDRGLPRDRKTANAARVATDKVTAKSQVHIWRDALNKERIAKKPQPGIPVETRDPQSPTEPQRKSNSVRFLAAGLLAIVLFSSGVLALAGLKSQPFGPALAGWSHGILAKTRNVFSALYLSFAAGEADNESAAILSIPPTSGNKHTEK